MRLWMPVFCSLAMAGCASEGGGSKVLQDFGLQDRPEGYVSGSEKVMAKLPEVGKVEIERLNLAQRRGEVLYDDKDALHGVYYKQVKIYEDYHPLDAQAASRTSQNSQGGFVGYLEYTFQWYESSRKATKTEAAAELADIPTNRRGREKFRYRFDMSGAWNGGKGEPFKD